MPGLVKQDIVLPGSSSTLLPSSSHELVVDPTGPRRIDCGLPPIDEEKFRRDFVVHSGTNTAAGAGPDNSLNFNWSSSKVNIYSSCEYLEDIQKSRFLVMSLFSGNGPPHSAVLRKF